MSTCSNTPSCGRPPARRGPSSPSTCRPSSNHVSQGRGRRWRSKCPSPIERGRYAATRWAKFSSAVNQAGATPPDEPVDGQGDRDQPDSRRHRDQATVAVGTIRPCRKRRVTRPTLGTTCATPSLLRRRPDRGAPCGSASRHPSRCFPARRGARPCRRSGVPRPGRTNPRCGQARVVRRRTGAKRRARRAASEHPNWHGPSPRARVRSLFPTSERHRAGPPRGGARPGSASGANLPAGHP